MKQLVTMALLLCFALPMMAQNKKEEDRIQLARDRYAEGQSLISSNKQYEEDEIPAVNYMSAVRKQNWAGSGQSVDKMDFYYHEIEDDMEPYPVGYALVMVHRAYNAGSTDYFEEYVYDDEGRPLFWFTSYYDWVGDRSGVKVELRQYYGEGGEAIRVICKVADEEGKMKECPIDDFVNPLAHAIEDFMRFKTMFDALYNMNVEN